jgi:hypothetical protein
MILLFNIFMTDHRTYWGRPAHMARHSWVDIFKYTVASYTVFSDMVSRSLFYISLDWNYVHLQGHLEDYIRQLWPDAVMVWQRCVYQQDWQRLCAEHVGDGDDVIWLCGNDDHVFIDYDTHSLAQALAVLRADPNPMSTLYYSHWNEQMNMQAHRTGGQLTACGGFVHSPWLNYDSIQLLKTERFRDYWYGEDLGDRSVHRTDELRHCLRPQHLAPLYVPTRPMTHHYDGYMHAACGHNLVPPLVIPPGWFEDQVRVRVGYTDRLADWVNVNACMPNVAGDPTGADLQTTVERIPLFWRHLNKIVELDINPHMDAEAQALAADRCFLAQSHVRMNTWSNHFEGDQLPPLAWFTRHLLRPDAHAHA